jgi:TonB family protein
VVVELDDVAMPEDSQSLLLGAEQPPPIPAVVPEGTPGLLAPVRRPGAAQPVYPPIAVQAKLGGRVVLSAVIGEDGRVREIVVLSAPRPDVGFADAAIEAVRSWEYEPGRMRGRAVAVQLTVVVQFRLR